MAELASRSLLLAETKESMDSESHVSYTPGDPNDIAAQIDSSLGLSPRTEGSVKKGEGEGEGGTVSKSKAKKDAKKAEKAEKVAQRQQQARAASAAAGASSGEAEVDPLASNYGDVPVEDIQSKTISGRTWTSKKLQ